MIKLPYEKCREIENDMGLRQYLFEMNYQRNDGWLQQYYREKYQERLNYLLHEKSIGTWWWRIYRWSSCQKVKVYQLAADMGGAGYIFTGFNDANVMHNSAMINLNVASQAAKYHVKKLFYSSSACMYPEHNQLDPNNPNCEESSAYPANPDSEYGWEKLFSERVFMAYSRNYGLNVRIARFHNIFGTEGTWNGGKEKSPAAICRKVAESKDGDQIEIWGDGNQTRSFLYVDECVEAVQRLMETDFQNPVNIGSEEMVSMNQLAQIAIDISGKHLTIKNIHGNEFLMKYGYPCPLGVKGRNSHNKLFREVVGWEVSQPLKVGIEKLYNWIDKKVNHV